MVEGGENNGAYFWRCTEKRHLLKVKLDFHNCFYSIKNNKRMQRIKVKRITCCFFQEKMPLP